MAERCNEEGTYYWHKIDAKGKPYILCVNCKRCIKDKGHKGEHAFDSDFDTNKLPTGYYETRYFDESPPREITGNNGKKLSLASVCGCGLCTYWVDREEAREDEVSERYFFPPHYCPDGPG